MIEIKTKLVTVLMSVYGEKENWLREAIDSILSQTYPYFEFIIILDKPDNDNLWQILKEYEVKDKRIILIKNNMNVGLAASLNKGIEISKGEYMVRMDADDISISHRIETLVEFMENNTEIGVCSSWMKAFDGPFLQNRIVNYPTKHDDLEIRSLYQTPISHAACIIRRNIIEEYSPLYNIKCCRSQDYELWSRLMRNGVTFACVPKVLFLRRSPSNMGPQRIPYQVIHNQISRFNIRSVLSSYNIPLPDKIQESDITYLSSYLKKTKSRIDKKKLCTILLLYYFTVENRPIRRFSKYVFSGDIFKCITLVPIHLSLRMVLLHPSADLRIDNFLENPNMSIC